MTQSAAPTTAPPPNLIAPPDRVRALRLEAADLPAITLEESTLGDLELLLNGGFAPLTGFMDRAEFESVQARMRLADGSLWPLPVVLPVDPTLAERLAPGARAALRDVEGHALAVLHVSSVWRAEGGPPDGPTGLFAGGRVEGIALPERCAFARWRHTPAALRAEFAARGWREVLAFHTTRPLHRLHLHVAVAAAESAGLPLLVHPAVGAERAGDFDRITCMRCYRALLDRLPANSMLSLLPLAPRSAGPREALLHAIVRRNYGCTHLLVGPGHANPPPAQETPAWPEEAAFEQVREHASEIGIEVVGTEALVWAPSRAAFAPRAEVSAAGEAFESLPEDDAVRTRVTAGALPTWVAFPEAAAILARRHPPPERAGMTIFLTGLSGSGKSTIARLLHARLVEDDPREATLLDGDDVRRHLSSGLGFSRADRDLNIRRIGFVAAEITRHGGIAICCPIAPYAATRREVRAMVERHGAFVEVHVATPLAECERRDPKGLYAKARRGEIAEFTGVSDPYEAPEHPEVRVDTRDAEPAESVGRLLDALAAAGLVVPATPAGEAAQE